MHVFWFERRELGQVVDVHTRFAGVGLGVGDPYDDTARVDAVDHAAARCDDAHARVTGDVSLHAGADERLLRYGCTARPDAACSNP